VPTGSPTDAPGVTGEILVRAPWAKDRYDRLAATQAASTEVGGWHRSGDVGHLDDQGRLWVEGRLAHVVSTPRGALTPVGLEQRVETLPEVAAAACVGVGPPGTQVVVVVVVPTHGPGRRERLACPGLAARVRAAAQTDVAAVLVRGSLPVDVRHNSKIARTALSLWAGGVLS
jgi:acyl-coenzyme A synthetase/AMP-(fatty) acid ligase